VARFTAYAEVLTPDHIQYKAYQAGIRKNPPGRILADLLEKTGGVYEFELDLSEEFRGDIRRVAQLTGDQELLEIASRPAAPVSLEHLRHLDPQKTRIVLGHRLDYTQEESDQLQLRHEGPFDPRTTIHVEEPYK
jgi:hypothetical protein